MHGRSNRRFSAISNFTVLAGLFLAPGCDTFSVAPPPDGPADDSKSLVIGGIGGSVSIENDWLDGPFPLSAVRVRNEQELRDAAVQTLNKNLKILVDRPITLTQAVNFPQSNSIVHLIGTNPSAELKINIPFNGSWATFVPIDALNVRCRQFTMTGLTVSGFENGGSVVFCRVNDRVDISDCVFRNHGTIIWPFRVWPPQTAADTINCSVIVSHGMTYAHISIVNCRFENCSTNITWSHCVYAEAKSLLVTGCKFIRCGNVFRLGDNYAGSSCNILRNQIEDSRQTIGKNGVFLKPYIYQFSANDQAVFAWNKVRGEFENPLRGHPRFDQHFVDFNDFIDVKYIGPWGSDVDIGHYPWPVWQSDGFDVNSGAPLPGP